MAAPVFSKVAEYAVRQSGLSPVLITEKNILQNTKKQSHIQNHKAQKTSRDLSSEKGKTPDFIGLSLRNAYQKARREEIQLRVKGSGQVVRTSPPPLSPLPMNRTVELTLSE